MIVSVKHPGDEAAEAFQVQDGIPPPFQDANVNVGYGEAKLLVFVLARGLASRLTARSGIPLLF